MSDSAASLVRMRSFVQAKIGEHNKSSGDSGKFLSFDGWCFGHILMGIVVKTFRLRQAIPRCYSLNFTFRFGPRYNRLVLLLRVSLEKDFLNGGYVPEAGLSELHSKWEEHSRFILGLTLSRSLRTRGRGPIPEAVARNEALLISIFQVLQTMLTANIKSQHAGHLCRGCCSGYRDAACKLADALVSFPDVHLGSAQNPASPGGLRPPRTPWTPGLRPGGQEDQIYRQGQ